MPANPYGGPEDVPTEDATIRTYGSIPSKVGPLNLRARKTFGDGCAYLIISIAPGMASL